MQLLVRNKVHDFTNWFHYFNLDIDAASEYGLSVAKVWQAVDDPNNVFFLLNVTDMERANAFMARPESAETGEKAGVIDGEVYFLEPVSGGG